jgi:signal peptidase I
VTEPAPGHDGELGPERAGEPATEPEPTRRPGRRKGRRRKQRSFWRELPIILVVALVLSLLIKSFLLQAFYIPSGSMENTLLVGDRVFVNKLVPRFGDIQRGDVVVFRDPGDWLPPPPPAEGFGKVRQAVRDVLVFIGLAPSDSDDDLIKRVIGMPGDRVACCDPDGRVTVNGVALDEPYVLPGDQPSAEEFDVVVPDGSLWLMGDHRSVSQDSRAHQDDARGGMVPVDNVLGRAFAVVWPLDQAKRLQRPDTFDEPSLDRG